MGFAMDCLEYLAARGHLDAQDCTILDIGSQNLYHATPESIRQFVERYGRIEDEEAFQREAERLAYFSTPRPGERTSYLSELLDLTRIGYTSYDICPALKTEIFDLNVEQLPSHYHEHFDVLLNFGTTEHIINQLNCFQVMHEAAKVGGIFFHQIPSIGWVDHGWFCYHEGYLTDLATANGYEVVDRWYSLAGKSDLAGMDFRDPATPGIPHSAAIDPAQLTIPSFNLNMVLRKTRSAPFAIGLEIATSHSAVDAGIARQYRTDRALACDEQPDEQPNEQPDEQVSPAPLVDDPFGNVSGWTLLGELRRRAAKRLGAAPPRQTGGDPFGNVSGWTLARELRRRAAKRFGAAASVPQPVQQPHTPAAPDANRQEPPPVQQGEPIDMPLQVTVPRHAPLDAMVCVEKARELLKTRAFSEAFGYLNHARAIIHQYPHAMLELRPLAGMYAAAGELARSQGKDERAMQLAVLALEADPSDARARGLHASLAEQYQGPDTTRCCYVFYDQQRAEQVHREAIRRCLEYTAISGVVGDILEFGVLAGWSARLFAESMRDFMIMGDLHLFDSFAGLPEYASGVDRASYEIAGRNIWSDKMKFPDEFVASLGGSLEGHIKERLSTIIRGDRITTRKGYYEESLKTPLATKAALVHIDCDLYQSTVEVLDALLRDDTLQDGCVIMFDDWNCNKANPSFGERRAFREFLEKQRRFGASEFFSYGFNGMTYILHDSQCN